MKTVKHLFFFKFRTPTPWDVRKKGSKILKLPSVRNCFTLVMTNKLVVIINSLKVPKIKKILLYEMKFIVPNYSCLQNPWLGGYRPHIHVLSVLNRICRTPPEQNSWIRHWTTPQTRTWKLWHKQLSAEGGREIWWCVHDKIDTFQQRCCLVCGGGGSHQHMSQYSWTVEVCA